MEFLSRSWSLSAVELSKALSHADTAVKDADRSSLSSVGGENGSFTVSSEPQHQPLPKPDSPPTSPRGSDDTKELFLLHQALNPDFLASQQLLRNGLYKNLMRGKTMGRWIKDQKVRRKQELRTHNAQLHAAVSVAGVAAAVAALAASSLTSQETFSIQNKTPSKTSTAIASAAALVASHCIEIAEDMGACFLIKPFVPAVVVSGVYYDIQAWPGREREDSKEQRAYFGIKTSDRIIEFECRNKSDKLIWIEGIQHMLDCRTHV